MNALKSGGVTVLAFVAVFVLLSACGFPEPGTPAPTCGAASLVAPDIPVADSPVADSLRPTFQWFYSGLCTPDGFRVEIAPNGNYASPEVVVGTANATAWTPPADLHTVQLFEWRVAAFSRTNQGPYSISQTFFTGPVCDSLDLLAPTLVSPDTGAWVTEGSPVLSWESPRTDCLQTSYRFEVSVDPSFSTHVLSGQGGPWPSFDTNLDYLGEDCTTYFWRVAATWGEDVVGPYAQDFFHTQFGDTCAGQMDLAVVLGTLWSDVCPATGVCSGTPPEGCTCLEGYLGADGIRQPDEVGIPGVVVRFGTGPCPASGWTGTAVGTDARGGYYEWLPAGTYCFWIDDSEPGNAEVLQPGLWTHPVPYDTPFGHTVTVLEGEERTGEDFGWQFAAGQVEHALISGVVWSDQCPVSGPCTATQPSTCQCLEGTLGGDSHRQPDEPGIGGVSVRVGPGPCLASHASRQTTTTVLTDVNGAYQLSLNPGAYCIWVDAVEAGNAAVLGEGLWTIPPAYDAPFGYNLTLDPGGTRGDLEFGWWSAEGPAPQSPTGISVTAIQDAFCRFGPATVYEQTGHLLRGQTATLLARNAVGTWYYIQEVNGSGQCWIAASLVMVNGDTGGLQVRQAPPTPTPVPSATPTPTVTPTPEYL